MLLRRGIHKFKAVEPDFFYASVSSLFPTTVTVKRNGEEEDVVYVSNGSTHTWWSNNHLFNPPLKRGEDVEIVIDGDGVFRLECGGLERG